MKNITSPLFLTFLFALGACTDSKVKTKDMISVTNGALEFLQDFSISKNLDTVLKTTIIDWNYNLFLINKLAEKSLFETSNDAMNFVANKNKTYYKSSYLDEKKGVCFELCREYTMDVLSLGNNGPTLYRDYSKCDIEFDFSKKEVKKVTYFTSSGNTEGTDFNSGIYIDYQDLSNKIIFYPSDVPNQEFDEIINKYSEDFKIFVDRFSRSTSIGDLTETVTQISDEFYKTKYYF